MTVWQFASDNHGLAAFLAVFFGLLGFSVIVTPFGLLFAWLTDRRR